jgi:hypothetical protein
MLNESLGHIFSHEAFISLEKVVNSLSKRLNWRRNSVCFLMGAILSAKRRNFMIIKYIQINTN